MPPRITVLTGHYGSGKSEFAVNLALKEAKAGKHVALVDMDIVNPYFRSREKRQMLEEAGIRVIGNSLEQDQGIDLPAVSAEMYAPLQDERYRAIFDSGGNAAGARLLATFRSLLSPEETELLCVCNANRPETADAQGILRHIRSIESVSGLQISGLINNTHMMEHTTLQDILKGYRICTQVTELTGIPLRWTTVPLKNAETYQKEINHFPGEILPVTMYLREAWMNEGEHYGKS